MVDWDNKEMLINFIRHSFISCDDAGICEAVLEPPTVVEKPGVVCSYISEGSYDETGDDQFDPRSGGGDHEAAHSPDIRIDMGHRRRSETSKRLETLKQQRNLQSRIKTVNWNAAAAHHEQQTPESANKNREKWAEVFVKREINAEERPKVKTSAVSEMLKTCEGQPKNPFLDYARFDAHGSGGKSVKIFLTMLQDPAKRAEPLQISVVSNARVKDLIGLACFHYMSRNLEPPLDPNVKKFALYVAEDNGDIDADLPPRSPTENVSRFHFPYLALVQIVTTLGIAAGSKHQKKLCFTVHTVTSESYAFDFDSLDANLRTLRDMAVEKHLEDRKHSTTIDVEYNLEKLNEPGVSLNLDHSLASVDVNEFCLVRMNSSRVDATNASSFASSDISSGSLCPPSINRFYTITLLHKFKRTSNVQLSVSNEYIDVVPITDKKKNAAGRLLHSFQRSASFRTGKAFHIAMKDVGLVEILNEKPNGRKSFQISYQSANSGEWKALQFESDASVVDDLVFNVNFYLETVKSTTVSAISASKDSAALRKNSSSRFSYKSSSLLKRLHLQSSSTTTND